MAESIEIQLRDRAAARSRMVDPYATMQPLGAIKGFGRIHCPFRMSISGPTMAGKSEFAFNLVKHRDLIFEGQFKRVLWFLPEDDRHLHQDFIDRLLKVCPELKVHGGLPDVDMLRLRGDKQGTLVVIDDQATQALQSDKILKLITKDSHHTNTSVILISQNFFEKSKYNKTIQRQFSERVIFMDPTDALQLRIISYQMFAKRTGFLKEVFEWIYKHRANDFLKYVVIDGNSLSPVPINMNVRTAIFPEKDGDPDSIRPIYFFPERKE